MKKLPPRFSEIQKLKGKRIITAITAYDYPTARLIDEIGMDFILVGDSLGMVILGHPDTTQVKIEHIIHHLVAVRNGVKKALLIGDLPIHTYDNPKKAKLSAILLREAGADCIKLEGGFGQEEKIRAILGEGIPVMGHIGMLPQSIHQIGGYKKSGKTPKDAEKLIAEAKLLEELGCFALVLECVLDEIAKKITAEVQIPTIGIGCGEKNCDGEIAVIHDIIGSFPWFVPQFVQAQGQIAKEVQIAVQKWKKQIQS